MVRRITCGPYAALLLPITKPLICYNVPMLDDRSHTETSVPEAHNRPMPLSYATPTASSPRVRLWLYSGFAVVMLLIAVVALIGWARSRTARALAIQERAAAIQASTQLSTQYKTAPTTTRN